jgi:hypothetical protein
MLPPILASAIHSRIPVADVAHILGLRSTKPDVVVEVLQRTLSILDSSNDGISDLWTWEFLGVAVEVYRCGNSVQHCVVRRDLRFNQNEGSPCRG